MSAAAVTSPPTGIQREPHKVCESQFSAGTFRSAAWQGAKRLQIYCLRSLGGQIRVEEVLVGEFVVGIVVDVLGHVGVEHRKSGGVGWISASIRFFAVLNAPEFVVLHPEVSLQDLRCSREPKQGCISSSEMTTMFFTPLLR